MAVEMVVTGLAIDPVNNTPIVILRERDGSRIVPIWIGVVEASAIAFELEDVQLTRPMTHDLLKATIEALGGAVHEITITDLRDNTYFALVEIRRGGESFEIDARPSDAIALALRTGSVVRCAAEVVERAHVRQQSEQEGEEQAASAEKSEAKGESKQKEEEAGPQGPKPILSDGTVSFEELLENLNPEDFGKYKM